MKILEQIAKKSEKDRKRQELMWPGKTRVAQKVRWLGVKESSVLE